MIPPTTEFHRHRHAEHTARLRSELHRHQEFSPRRALGSWLVSAGVWLAPDVRPDRRVRIPG